MDFNCETRDPETPDMAMLKLAFYAGLVLFGVVGMYMGAVFFLAAGLSGPISISYPQDGKVISETVSRATDGARHFRLQLMLGWAPVLLGAVALYAGVRWFRR